MYRLKMIKNVNSKSAENIEPQRWDQLLIASLLFIAGNLMDYILTAHGISNGVYEEANPIIREYIDHFGIHKGLLLFKGLMGSFIIFGVIVFDKVCKEKGINFRSEFILYAGAIATTIAGALWLTGI